MSELQSSPATGLELEVVLRLSRLVTRVLETDVPVPLTVRQYRILSRLSRGEGDALGALAARSGIGTPSMSQTIDGLVARGWVTRSEDPRDRRRRNVTLTSAGRAVVAAAEQALSLQLADLLSGLSHIERRALTEGLAAVGRELDHRWQRLVEQRRG